MAMMKVTTMTIPICSEKILFKINFVFHCFSSNHNIKRITVGHHDFSKSFIVEVCNFVLGVHEFILQKPNLLFRHVHRSK